MMSFRFRRLLAYPTILLAALAGWWFLEPNNELSGADARCGSMMSIEDDSDAARAMNHRQAELRSRIDYKERLMLGLVAGEYTLKEVSREFARVNADDETTLHMMRCGYPGETDQEKAAYNVLDFLKARQLPHEELKPVLARMQYELDCLFPH